MKIFALLFCAIAPFVMAVTPQEQPLFPGDSSSFVDDVTYPDGSTVAANAKITKTWRIRNRGTVVWEKRELRIQGDARGFKVTKSRPFSTKPKTEVDVSVELSAPSEPGRYKIYFKQWAKVGKEWKMALPNKQGVYIDVVVK